MATKVAAKKVLEMKVPGKKPVQGVAVGERGPRGRRGERGMAGNPGPIGPRGFDGLDAYEIAKANGFEGTQKEWLAALKGPQGEAAPVAVEQGVQLLSRRVEVTVYDHDGVRRSRTTHDITEDETLNLTVSAEFSGASVTKGKREVPAAAA